MERTSIIKGPAIITFNGATIYTKDDITLSPGITWGEITTSMHGMVDKFIDDIVSTISFTPAGQWVTEHLAMLWPYGNPTIGGSIFGTTDKDVVIQTLAGQQITWKAGALNAMPDIILSATKSPIGSATIACIGAKDTEWTDTAKRAVIAATAFSDTSFDPSQIIQSTYTGVLAGASAPWNDIQTQDGWTISFALGVDPVTVDSEGTVDMTINSVGVTAKCTPVGISEANLLAKLPLQGAGIRRGARASDLGADLTISGASAGDPEVVIKNAVLTDGPLQFGATPLRVGEIAFEAMLSFTAGARNALFTVGVVAE
jgi:hypothetical protein